MSDAPVQNNLRLYCFEQLYRNSKSSLQGIYKVFSCANWLINFVHETGQQTGKLIVSSAYRSALEHNGYFVC